MHSKMTLGDAYRSMGKPGKHIFETPIQIPLSVFKLINGVDMKWVETVEDFKKFFVHANSMHPSIKFAHRVSYSCINL